MYDVRRTDDPVADAERYMEYQDIMHERWLAGNTCCCICHKRIRDDECAVLDEYFAWDTAVCDSCKAEQLKKAASILNPHIVEALSNLLDSLVTETPNETAA